jgi:hypothetical protein
MRQKADIHKMDFCGISGMLSAHKSQQDFTGLEESAGFRRKPDAKDASEEGGFRPQAHNHQK